MEAAAKAKIAEEFGKNAQDTGSVEVQVAILTTRIKELTEHMKQNRKDFGSQRGLQNMVSRRRRLLDYLNRNDRERYQALIQKLGLRR